MNRNLLLKIVLIAGLLLTGNLFWLTFTKDLQSLYVITASPVNIALRLLVPIILFAVYITFSVYFAVFIKNRQAWIWVVLVSFIDYPFVLGTKFIALIGLILLVATIFAFLYLFDHTFVIIKQKVTFTGQLAFAFTAIALVMSLIIAINFYSVYKTTLLSSESLASNKSILTSLAPVISLYYDDLKPKDPNELFTDYVRRQVYIQGLPADTIRTNVLHKLDLTSASNEDTIRTLVDRSLNNSIVGLIIKYKKLFPFIISLGLFLIIQTLLTVSSYLAILFTFFSLSILKKFRLVESYEKDLHISLLKAKTT